MSIHTNENGALKNTATDGSRVAIRMWPYYVPPYSNGGYTYDLDKWVDRDRPYLTITNPSVDYTWPFTPEYIVYLPIQCRDYEFAQACIIYQGAEPITKPVSQIPGSWISDKSPSNIPNSGYYVYGESSASLSGNIMTITYTPDRSKDTHSADDPRYIQGIFIAVA